MLGIILTILIIGVVLAGLFFTRTTKSMPKSAHELLTEFRFQYSGVLGLLHDFWYHSRDQVVLSKQTGRIAVITGGNRGIGLRVIEKLLACEMTVIMGVRDPNGVAEAILPTLNAANSKGKLICEALDVGNMSSVRAFAQRIKTQYPKIDVLINNAGIMFAPYKLTPDGFESHFAINYLGHFLLTQLLLPQLRAAGREGRNSRIINVSSCVNLVGSINYEDINGIKYYYEADAYAQSKLAQILFTRHLQTLLDAEQAHVQVTAVHPGIVDTDLFEHTATTSVPWFKKVFFKRPERGARTIVYAAIEPAIEGQGGLYLCNGGKGPYHADAKNPAKCERFFKFSCDLLNIRDYLNAV